MYLSSSTHLYTTTVNLFNLSGKGFVFIKVEDLRSFTDLKIGLNEKPNSGKKLFGEYGTSVHSRSSSEDRYGTFKPEGVLDLRMG